MKQYKKMLVSILIALFFVNYTSAQQIRWMRIGDVQSPFSEEGAEYETIINYTGTNSNFFAWQPQYDINNNVARLKALLIGCKNFYDPVEKKIKSVKVVGTTPKAPADPNQIFPVEIKLIAKNPAPTVTVDDGSASAIAAYDTWDEINPNLPCDRMIIIRFHTSIGITVTKKIYAFSQSNHSNYFIYEFIFKNTGIINKKGDKYEQKLDSVWFYWLYRYAFGGVSSSWGSTWGAFPSLWGVSTLNHAFGTNPSSTEYTDPASKFYKLRGFYSYFSPVNKDNPQALTYDEDWGCPNMNENGELASAKYAGVVTLHADKSATDKTDDEYQPRTTWYISPDIPIFATTSPSQYDETFMADRWAAITEGHPTIQHDDLVGSDYAENYKDSRRNVGGGVAMGQGFGPYTLNVGDSVRIVVAEGVSGIGWEKGREVGANWLQWKKGTGRPTLVLPNGTTTTDYNYYKKAWIFTGLDSLLKTFRNAKANFQSNYTLPQAPPPPAWFTIESGGDRIRLTWADNAKNHPHAAGYVIYRSKGSVLTWRTVYEKIFETSDPSVTSYDDTGAVRGFDYFYYIQSKDDGTQVPGTVLYSSLFWTLTNTGAVLGRPAGSALEKVRVVPNPYDIRGRFFQFGDRSLYDRIVFYGLPPKCLLKIFTESGECIWEKMHTRTTGDEVWDSKTKYGQIVVSGIYILYVEVLEDTYDTWINRDNRLLYKKGDTVIRKFVIIR
ncbi:MAG: hypothetical protein N3A63_09425 [Bacteroidetes bacterium]|nr:hypothetical protein [Bacteroidota bacterium]